MKPRTPIVAAQEAGLKSNQAAEILRRTEIIVESELLSVRYGPGCSYHGLCPQCGSEVLMITAESASATLGATRRQVYRWLEEGKFHFQESSAGETFICWSSISSIDAKTQ